MWTRVLDKIQRARLKAQRKSSKKSSRRKSLLSERGSTSGSGESAAVHFVQSDLTGFSDGTGESDNDPAVASTVEILSVAGNDELAPKQEKEARSVGGILFQ